MLRAAATADQDPCTRGLPARYIAVGGLGGDARPANAVAGHAVDCASAYCRDRASLTTQTLVEPRRGPESGRA